MTAIESGLGCAPDRVDLQGWRAYVLFCLGKKKKAVSEATEALGRDPHSVLALLVRSQAYSRLGQKSEAENDVRRALVIDPENVVVLGVLAQVLRQQDRFKESEDVLKSLLSRAPRDCFGLTNAGWLAIESGNLEMAAEYVRSALSIEPTNEFARRTWFEILRRRIFFYRWEEKWKEGVVNLFARDWTKSKLKYAVIIPHAGVLLVCCFGFFFVSGIILWVLARSWADFWICVNPTTRASLTTSEWHLALLKGFVIVPVLIYLMLTQQWLISSICFVAVVMVLVGLWQLIGFCWRYVVSSGMEEN